MADDKPSKALQSPAEETEKPSPQKKEHTQSRRKARSIIFHLLYAAECHDYQSSIQSVVENLNRGFDADIEMDSAVVKTTEWIVEHRNDLDLEYSRFFENWPFERISVPTKLILRFAMWELLQTDIDPRIIINEAIELAKCFAEDDAYRFINGVLDRATKDLGRYVQKKTEE